MQTTQSVKARFSGSELVDSRPLALVLMGVLLALVGCGPSQEAPESSHLTPHAQAITSIQEAGNGLLATNGISMNGISMNGISMNGISMNGISMNGISMNGISTEEFSEWFQSDPAQNEVFMRYLVRCGLARQKSLTYRDPISQQTYTWTGLLGLTPKWARGEPAARPSCS